MEKNIERLISWRNGGIIPLLLLGLSFLFAYFLSIDRKEIWQITILVVLGVAHFILFMFAMLGKDD